MAEISAEYHTNYGGNLINQRIRGQIIYIPQKSNKFPDHILFLLWEMKKNAVNGMEYKIFQQVYTA